LVENLESLEYREMTPIQALSLPHILAGKDVIAQGKTGSGKTAAFGLGLLDKLELKQFQVQVLVLCPTRELADQVAKEIRRLGRAIQNIKVTTLCGGMPFGPQVGSLEHGAHVVVGTPGRIEDHLNRGTLNLNNVNTLVLDEADRMLDMGFQPALDAIIEKIPSNRQTLLFSATFPEQIKSISKRIMRNPEIVKAESIDDGNHISQFLYEVEDHEDRLTAVRLLLMSYAKESVVVFCTTKRETQEVADDLYAYGFRAMALHGDLEQRDRDQTLVRFASKSISVLVATDVASRGLDINALDMVINYQIAHDPEVHVHRIGRTGRAGNTGIACTLYNANESHKINRIEAYLGHSFESKKLPSETLLQEEPYKPLMTTLLIDGGKKQKLRPGDILGALTGKNGIEGKKVGKIHIFDNRAYVAVSSDVAKVALKQLNEGKLKGRTFRVRFL